FFVTGFSGNTNAREIREPYHTLAPIVDVIIPAKLTKARARFAFIRVKKNEARNFLAKARAQRCGGRFLQVFPAIPR
ncbi:hypothetical protein M569_01788, partial [Genlisea aurea]